MMRKILLASLITLCTMPSYGRIGNGEDSCAFSPPLPPMVITGREERLAYFAEHYWQGLDYANNQWLADSVALEQVFVNWFPVLDQLQLDNRQKAMATVITYGSEYPLMQKRLGELAELYFHDPNSPYRNEELYIPILEALIEAPKLEDIEKERYRYQLQKALLNRPGTSASDVKLITKEQHTIRLYDIDSNYVLLYFFNPDCHACQTISAYITHSAIYQKWADGGKMKVVAIYPDEDLSAWEKHVSTLPKQWLVTRYADAADKDVYDLPAIPNLYLLDKDKKVILKDATVEQIEEWLRSNA